MIDDGSIKIIINSVATSPVVWRWLCDSPWTGCAWRTTPYIYAAQTSNNRVIMACELYCCLLPQCAALRIYAARDFRSQQNGACAEFSLHTKNVRSVQFVVKRKGCMLLQPLRWCCVDCVIHHERDVREEQHHTYMWREQATCWRELGWHTVINRTLPTRHMFFCNGSSSCILYLTPNAWI